MRSSRWSPDWKGGACLGAGLVVATLVVAVAWGLYAVRDQLKEAMDDQIQRFLLVTAFTSAVVGLSTWAVLAARAGFQMVWLGGTR